MICLQDNAPVFEAGNESISVKEDTKVGTIIGTVKARDADEGQNGKVAYILDRKSSMVRNPSMLC